MRRVALLLVLTAPGCFNPDDPAADTDPSGSSSGSSGETSDPSDTTDTMPTSATGSTGTTNPTDPTTSPTTDPTDTTTGSTDTTDTADDSSSTTDFVPGCDNGVVEDDELCYEDAVEIDTLVSTQGVAIDDLDGDGHLDLVIGDYGDGTQGGLYAYLGNGDGTFSDAIGTDDTPLVRVATGAIADGIVDVIALNATANAGIRRFRGDADGSFSSVTNYPGSTNWDVALADLDGDGRLDALGTTGSIITRFGTASESFGSETVYGGTNGFNCVKAADVNGDGAPDVFGCSSDGIFPLLNDGSGDLIEGEFFGTAGSDILIGDFDGDGNPDLAGTGNSVVTVYFGNGDGAFSDGPELTVNASPIAGKAADLDDDGFDDIIVVNTSGTTSILMSNGDGTFQSQQLFTMLDGYLYDMDMGDLNEDGAEDIVVVSPNAGPIQVLLSHV